MRAAQPGRQINHRTRSRSSGGAEPAGQQHDYAHSPPGKGNGPAGPGEAGRSAQSVPSRGGLPHPAWSGARKREAWRKGRKAGRGLARLRRSRVPLRSFLFHCRPSASLSRGCSFRADSGRRGGALPGRCRARVCRARRVASGACGRCGHPGAGASSVVRHAEYTRGGRQAICPSGVTACRVIVGGPPRQRRHAPLLAGLCSLRATPASAAGPHHSADGSFATDQNRLVDQ